MIISKTPLRISFFGGGTDLPAFYKREFGCVLSTSIDKYIYLTIHESFDEKYSMFYNELESVDSVNQLKNTRAKEVLNKFNLDRGVEVHSIGEVPSGSGLGSSSSFTVGMLNLTSAYLNRYVGKEDLANLASMIEIENLGEPIGKQDQYAAAYGGFNFIKFNEDDSVEVIPVNISDELINKIELNIVIFSLGKTRDASSVLEEQNKNIKSDKDKFEIMRKLKEMTIKMRSDLESGVIENFGKMLHEGWLLKKKMASNVSNSYIDDIYEKGILSGAEGGKVLGAGGGGFILFYCHPDKQKKLRTELSFLKELKIAFEKKGSRLIKND